MNVDVQFDLFARKPRSIDEATVAKALRDAVARTAARPNMVHGVTRAQLKRLMTPLPRITAYD